MYRLKDFKQSAIGAFMGIIIFFAVRGDNPFSFDPMMGLIITAVLIWIHYNGFRQKDKMQHFIMNISVSFGVSAFLAHTFGLIETSQIFTYDVFGSMVMIGVWVALGSAMLYDMYNFTSPLKRYYVRK